MFFSKIWFFLTGAVAAIALGLALLVPRPAERTILDTEDQRLERARWGMEMLLRENARKWVDLASSVAVQPAPLGQPRLKLDAILDEASRTETISADARATARDTLDAVLQQIAEGQRPTFLVAVDKTGRLVAGVGETLWSPDEPLSGYDLIRDALRGYLADDVWFEAGKLYRVAAAPVVERDRLDYVGAVLLGVEVNLKLATDLEKSMQAHVAFFARGELMVSSASLPPVTSEIETQLQAASPDEKVPGLLSVVSGVQAYRVAPERLPGEAGRQDGFFAVFAERPATLGLLGTLRALTRDDLAPAHFPWLALGIAFMGVIFVGVILMWWEADRPVHRLAADALSLAKGDADKMTESRHRGRFGGIARSVNLALEKLVREAAKTPSSDMGSMLGPPPEDSIFGGRPAMGGKPFKPGAAVVSSHQRISTIEEAPLPAELGRGAPPTDSEPTSIGRQRTTSSITGVPTPIAPAPAAPVPMAVPRPITASTQSDPMKHMPARSPTLMGIPIKPVTPIDEYAPVPSINIGESGSIQIPAGVRENVYESTAHGSPSHDLRKNVAEDPDGVVLRLVFDDFVAQKRQCGEPTEGLKLEKFAGKLKESRNQAIVKYGWKSVRFQVYVKDGKAAVKVLPIKS